MACLLKHQLPPAGEIWHWSGSPLVSKHQLVPWNQLQTSVLSPRMVGGSLGESGLQHQAMGKIIKHYSHYHGPAVAPRCQVVLPTLQTGKYGIWGSLVVECLSRMHEAPDSTITVQTWAAISVLRTQSQKKSKVILC